jgi:hypothetical protein
VFFLALLIGSFSMSRDPFDLRVALWVLVWCPILLFRLLPLTVFLTAIPCVKYWGVLADLREACRLWARVPAPHTEKEEPCRST